MTDRLTHTPYHGSSRPFTIGLSQLDPEDWIEPDEDLDAQLAEKARLLSEYGDLIFRAEAGTETAQQEVLDSLAEYLPRRHPHLYSHSEKGMHVAGRLVDPADLDIPALQRAGMLVQDDLVLMRRGQDGWRIAAAFLAFPSSWSLAEKFGKVMDEVHAPVPDFSAGTRNATLISRMFDNLSPERIVVRWNWSVNWRRELYHPQPSSEEERRTVPAEDAVIRVERQTLRKLPINGDLLFTIRIYLDPVRTIMAQPNGAELAASLARQLEELTPEQAAYKGLLGRRAHLIELLRPISQPSKEAEFTV